MIKIAITDDHPIVTQGLQHLLSMEKNIRIEKILSSGQELMQWLPENSIDVLLLDIYLNDANGMDLCAKISELNPEIGIIAISGQDEAIVISQMLQNGALGYVLKNAESHEIIEAINQVYFGQKYLCRRTREALEKLDNSLNEIPKITRREKEVLQLIAEGLTTTEIATKLFISPHTVESHRKNLMEKFHVKSTASVLNKVKDLGLI
jgi:DNA-binding NarL/FixJ family response regulator